MKKTRVFALIVFFLTLAGSCASESFTKGCWGYWEKENGLKRGTRLNNQNYTKPYRQCVDEDPPHIDLERRPWG